MRILLVLLLFSSTALGGSANSVLKCDSKSGLESLYAEVPGDHTEFLIKWTQKGKTIVYADDYTKAKGKVVSNLVINRNYLENRKDFYFSVEKKSKILFKLKAKPKTVNAKETREGGTRGNFEAEVMTGGKTFSLNCIYNYQV